MNKARLDIQAYSPRKVLLLIAGVVLVVELIVMLTLELWLAPMWPFNVVFWSVFDAVVLTVLISPVLYLLVIQKLKYSEAKFRQVTEAAQDAMIIVNQYGRVTDWNQSAQDMFQYQADEARGQSILALIVPGALHHGVEQRFVEMQQGRLLSGHGRLLETKACRKDGSIFPVEISISMVHTPAGWYVFGVVRDITDRQIMQQQLLESRQRYRLVVSGSRAGVWDWNMMTNELFCSSRWGEMLGYSMDDDLPTRISDWENLVHPDDRTLVAEMLRRHLKAQQPYQLEYRLKLQQGHYRWFYLTGQALWDDQGEPVRMAGSLTDITEQRWIREVQDFLTLKSYLHEDMSFFEMLAHFITNRLQVEYVSISALTDDDMIGQHVLVFQDGKMQENNWFDLQDTPFEQITSKKIMVLAKGAAQQFPLDAILQQQQAEGFIGARLFSSDNRPLGVLTVISRAPLIEPELSATFIQMLALRVAVELERQIHEQTMQQMLDDAAKARQVLLSVIEDRKRSEDALNQLDEMYRVNEELKDKLLAHTIDLEQARVKAEQASEAKSAFLATMSHEIRTPMNGVIGMLDVLRQSKFDTQQQEMVDVIYDSAFSLLAIVNDILDFSKIEAGKLQLDHTELDLSQLALKVCETLDHLARNANVSLNLFVAPDIPGALLGDPVRLRQILTNLINNAIKFSSKLAHAGKVSVKINLMSLTQERASIRIAVIDNGIGMDHDAQTRLFSAFAQADSSTTRKYGGTGLGLVITQQLVQLMGGAIDVQSEAGRGSTFYVDLTLQLAPQQSEILLPSLAQVQCLLWLPESELRKQVSRILRYQQADVKVVATTQQLDKWLKQARQTVVLLYMDTALSDDLLSYQSTYHTLPLGLLQVEQGRRKNCRQHRPGFVSIDTSVAFYFELPQAVAAAAGLVELNMPTRTDKGDREPARVMSREQALAQDCLILIAEDNPVNQKVILRQLELTGWAADMVSDGRQALQAWRTGQYHLLMTDLDMPEMDGYSLTRAVREEEKEDQHIPIIAFSANAMSGEVAQCRSAGMDDYLSKPVQLSALTNVLNKWMPRQQPASEPSQTISAAEPVQSAEEGNREADNADVLLDVRVLTELVGEDDGLIAEFLLDFCQVMQQTSQEIHQACEQQQIKQAGRLAHKLKSSARSVGAIAFGHVCYELEQAGKAEDSARLAQLLPQFDALALKLRQYIEQHYQQENTS